MRVTYREYDTSDWHAVVNLNLRAADQEELKAATGGSVFAALCASLEASDETWVIEMGDEIVGVFGVSDLGTVGIPWFVCTDKLFESNDGRAGFAYGSREIIRGWKVKYPFLTNCVAKDHTVARRWLRWLGFSFTAGERFLSDPSVPFIQFYMEGDREVQPCAIQ